MAQLLERHPDNARQAQWWVLKAQLADQRGDSAAAEPLFLKAVELAARCSAAKWAAMGHGKLAWLRYAPQDYLEARESLDVAMHWARQMEPEDSCLILENKLLVLSAFVARDLCRYDEVRAASRSALACGETLGLPSMQLGALQGLTTIDADLGLWESSAVWATRMHGLALTMGFLQRVAAARWHPAYAAESMGRHASAIPLYEEVVDLSRACGDRRKEALALQCLSTSHLASGRASEARQFMTLSQALHQTLDDPIEACITAGHVARCELALGQLEAALSTVNGLPERLSTDGRPVHETIEPRWACQSFAGARRRPGRSASARTVLCRRASLGRRDDRRRRPPAPDPGPARLPWHRGCARTPAVDRLISGSSAVQLIGHQAAFTIDTAGFGLFTRCYHCAYSIRSEKSMEVAIRKMGNSHGVLIPKPILAQVGLEGTADLQVRDGVIEIRPIRRNPREGWAEDAERVAQDGGDSLVWPELANEGDRDLVW